MIRVDSLELLLVKACGITQHVVDVEVFYQVIHAEDVLVRGQGPAQQGQVVEHALRDDAVIAVVKQVGLRVALRQLLIALAHHEG